MLIVHIDDLATEVSKRIHWNCIREPEFSSGKLLGFVGVVSPLFIMFKITPGEETSEVRA